MYELIKWCNNSSHYKQQNNVDIGVNHIEQRGVYAPLVSNTAYNAWHLHVHP